MKFVVIVNEGDWGSMKRERGDYDIFNRSLIGALDAREGEENEGRVKVMDNTMTALEEISCLASDAEAVLVFTTRGMIREAKKVKEEHPKLRVVVLTGLASGLHYPDLVIVDKGELIHDMDMKVRQAILGE